MMCFSAHVMHFRVPKRCGISRVLFPEEGSALWVYLTLGWSQTHDFQETQNH
jgi:hypothetical protein